MRSVSKVLLSLKGWLHANDLRPTVWALKKLLCKSTFQISTFQMAYGQTVSDTNECWACWAKNFKQVCTAVSPSAWLPPAGLLKVAADPPMDETPSFLVEVRGCEEDEGYKAHWGLQHQCRDADSWGWRRYSWLAHLLLMWPWSQLLLLEMCGLGSHQTSQQKTKPSCFASLWSDVSFDKGNLCWSQESTWLSASCSTLGHSVGLWDSCKDHWPDDLPLLYDWECEAQGRPLWFLSSKFRSEAGQGVSLLHHTCMDWELYKVAYQSRCRTSGDNTNQHLVLLMMCTSQGNAAWPGDGSWSGAWGGGATGQASWSTTKTGVWRLAGWHSCLFM